ncbi:hypothetical protein [Streptomyces antnestii]|uniref:hypothetical protein n=1 Tax=Streptomyces antnestii TaxID=2494256 RepID=UPI0026978EFB
MPPSLVHRITKYDPADRNEHGHYTGAEEAVSDHGPVEAAYLAAIAVTVERPQPVLGGSVIQSAQMPGLL